MVVGLVGLACCAACWSVVAGHEPPKTQEGAPYSSGKQKTGEIIGSNPKAARAKGIDLDSESRRVLGQYAFLPFVAIVKGFERCSSVFLKSLLQGPSCGYPTHKCQSIKQVALSSSIGTEDDSQWFQVTAI